MVRNARLLLLAAMLPAILSCSRDTRWHDVRVKEALNEGLGEYRVKGASAAVIMPDGSVHGVVAFLPRDISLSLDFVCEGGYVFTCEL